MTGLVTTGFCFVSETVWVWVLLCCGLRPGSPAIDAVACLRGVDVDQNGEARPNPGSASLATPCDVGAIEFSRPSMVSLTASGPLVEGGAPVTVTARFDSPTKTDGGLHLNLGGTATAGEQHNSPPTQNQQPQPQPQPQIPSPAEPQPQTGQPQPESGEPEPAPNPVPQPEPEPVEPQPEPEPQPQLQEQPQQTDPESQPQQQQTQEVASPAVVTGLVLTATANSVTASWQAATTGAVVDKYIVQLKAPRGEKGKNRRVDGTKTTTTFRNLTPGVTYKIKVRALNDAGKSQRVTATVTTPPTQ